MKTIYFIMLTACFLPSDLISQIKGPSHPLLEMYGPTRPEMRIYKRASYSYNASGNLIGYGALIYDRSADLLTDTVTLESGASRIDIYHYNEKNQLMYEHEFFPRSPWLSYNRKDYEYDEEGRLVKVISKRIQEKYPFEEILYESTISYSTIQMTEKGYIYDGVEYIFDLQDRLIQKNVLDANNDYMEFTDGKQYRIGDSYTSFTDNSYSEMGYYHSFRNFDIFVFDKWVENVCVFNEHGHLIQRTTRTSDDGVNWKRVTYTELEYEYNISNDVSNEKTLLKKTKNIVYAYSNAIHIVAEKAETVKIFDISGRPVIKQTVPQGTSIVNMAFGGLYFVKIGNESYKIFVKGL